MVGTAALFGRMLREEWRLHSRLFGGVRFALFPLFVFGLAAGAVWLLAIAGTGPEAVVAGMSALVFLFGLQTGSIGLVSREALTDLLGDLTLLLYAARTLPVSRRRVFGVFLAKDLVYYAALFLTPLSAAPAAYGAVAGQPDLVTRAPALWVALVGTFALGMATTFSLVGLARRGRVGKLALLAVAAVAGLAWARGVPLVRWTPYGFYAAPSLARFATGFASLPVAVVAGALLFDPAGPAPVRTAGNGFAQLSARLPVERPALPARTLLEVHRSSGGVGKLLFSGALVFAVSLYLTDLAGRVTDTDPSVGVAMGSLLGLTAFTTYNWLTQFDAPGEYLVHPLSVADVFRAKLVAFLALALPVGGGYFLLAALWFGAGVGETVVGFLLFAGLSVYLFGLTALLAGFDPNAFLFDTVLFAAFTVAVAVVLVPVLVAAFVGTPLPPLLAAGLVVGSVVLAAAGYGLYRRAVPRWARKLRVE